MFTSTISNKEIIISDANAHEVADDPKVNGEPVGRGYVPRDWYQHPFGAGPVKDATREIKLVPEADWKSIAEELESKKSRLTDLGVPRKNQKQTSLCWANATVHAEEVTRELRNQPRISLSPGSIAGPINGYHDGGGWGPKALERMISNGPLPSSIVADTNYACRKQVEDPANVILAAQFKVTEWLDLPERSWEYLISALLQLIPVSIGLNWWSHQVLAMDVVILPNGELGIRFDNSWGEDWSDNGRGILTKAKAMPDDAIAPRVLVA